MVVEEYKKQAGVYKVQTFRTTQALKFMKNLKYLNQEVYIKSRYITKINID
jgi:hypothetical protein